MVSIKTRICEVPRDGEGRRRALRRGGAALDPPGPAVSADVHPTAVVSPRARLADGVRVEPYAVVGDGVELGAGHGRRCPRPARGTRRVRGRQPDLPPRRARVRAAGPEVPRRGDEARGRKPERLPGVLDRPPGHGQGRRRDHRRRRQLLHGVRARRARQPDRVRHGVRELRVARGPRRGRETARCSAPSPPSTSSRASADTPSSARYTQCRQDILPFCKTDGVDAKTYGINTIGLKRQGLLGRPRSTRSRRRTGCWSSRS